MNVQKKEIKRKARHLGIFMMAHQLFFQLGATVLMIVLYVALGMAGMERLENGVLTVGSDVMQLIAGLFFLVFYLVNRKIIKDKPAQKKKCSPRLFGKCLIAIFAVNMILTVVDFVLVELTGYSLSVSMEGTLDMDPWVLFLTVAVFPAVVEELLYRGVLYRYLRGHGIQFAAIASSVIFGLIHLNFLQFFFATFLGVVCCYIYEATGKIRYSMLLHLLNNGVVVLFSVLPLSSQGSMMIQIVLGVAALVVAGVYLVHRGTKTDLTQQTQKSCLYFFTSVPMVIFTLICLGVCVYFSFF